jgi:hypothetical protein
VLNTFSRFDMACGGVRPVGRIAGKNRPSMSEHTSRAFPGADWHGFFLIQPSLWPEALAEYERCAANPCDHYIAEEAPDALLDEAFNFFQEQMK